MGGPSISVIIYGDMFLSLMVDLSTINGIIMENQSRNSELCDENRQIEPSKRRNLNHEWWILSLSRNAGIEAAIPGIQCGLSKIWRGIEWDLVQAAI